MNIQIKHKITAATLFEVEAGSLRAALEIAVGKDANLRDANLRDADLRGADLLGANLLCANLWGANLRDADLRDADLLGANLLCANLWGANLRDADLRDADLRGADLRDADLRGADLLGANLWGADLRDAKNAPAVIHGLRWLVLVWADKMRIGCQEHAIERWRKFSDRQISAMDPGALEFWNVWKAPLLAMADAKAATEPANEKAPEVANV